ncbi:MAG: hypothetical protein GQ544_04585, partial [Candidatus Aminicenantes bacterium]|nr:hypothetical protein [Candidatus Aminicenantes bacterium]
MSSYQRYLQDKTLYLNDRLAQIGCDFLCARILPSSLENGYRNRAKFKIFSQAAGPVLRGTDPIKGEVEVQKMLWILPDWGRDIVTRSFKLIFQDYAEFPVDGFEIQLTHGDQKVHLTLSVSKRNKQPYEALARELLADIQALLGIAVPSQKQVFGDTDLCHKLLGEVFQAHYSAFFQSNLGLTSELLRAAKTMLSNRPLSGIFDLYCGVGLFSLLVGTASIPIMGIDSQQHSIENANTNALHRGFAKTKYVCCDVQEYLRDAEIISDDLLILDPPRTGCPVP